MSQRQSDQQTGAQPGRQSQYQQSAGGGQGMEDQGPSRGQSAGQPPGSGTESVRRSMMGGGAAAGQGGTTGSSLHGQQFPTRNYLGEEVRTRTIETLNWVLADATVLHTHAKFAHWNLKGLEFVGLHELFDEIAETFEEHTDLIGERITALGGQAMGTAGMAVSNCSLPAMPTDAITGPEYVEILAERLSIHDANLYEAIRTAQDYGDDDTADLLNEVSREVSQHLWFLEAHLQTQPVGAAGTGAQAQGTGQRSQGQQAGGMSPHQPGGGQPAEAAGTTTTGSRGAGSAQPGAASYEQGQRR